MLNFGASKPTVKGGLTPPPEPHLLLCVWGGRVGGGAEVNRPASRNIISSLTTPMAIINFLTYCIVPQYTPMSKFWCYVNSY